MPSIFSCCFSANVVAPNSPAAAAAADPTSKADFHSVNPDEKVSVATPTSTTEGQTAPAETKPVLFGNAASACVQRVRFTAFEKGVELDFRNLDWPESKTAEYLQRQPLGKFPAMEHESLSFHESRAICMYLEERYKGRGATLVPEGLKPHTTFNQWLSIESTEILPSIYEILSQRIWGTWRGLTANEEVVAKSVTSAQSGLDYLEKQLADKEYILGDFSLIDIFFAPYIKLLMTLPEKTLIESRPNVLAWWQRVSARPGFAASQPPAQ